MSQPAATAHPVPHPTRAQTVLVETRIARGWTRDKIARHLALDPALVALVADEQARVAAEQPGGHQ